MRTSYADGSCRTRALRLALARGLPIVSTRGRGPQVVAHVLPVLVRQTRDRAQALVGAVQPAEVHVQLGDELDRLHLRSRHQYGRHQRISGGRARCSC
jgi:hypothetical protein